MGSNSTSLNTGFFGSGFGLRLGFASSFDRKAKINHGAL